MGIKRTIPMGLTMWLLATGVGGGAQPGSAPGGADSLKFDLVDQHLIVVRGAIGPLEGLRLLIDTGSIPSVVDRRIAKRLALSLQSFEFVSFGQKSRAMRAALPEIRLGPRRAGDVTAGVEDLSFLQGVDAVIGLDVLWRGSFSIDYKERRLVFGPVAARRSSVPLQVSPPFLTVQLAISGRPVRLLVDTGSQRLVLFERRVHGRLPLPPYQGTLSFHHASGAATLNRVSLWHVSIGDATLDRMDGFVSDAAVEAYPNEIDGVLGLRAVAFNGAVFDFERSRLALGAAPQSQ